MKSEEAIDILRQHEAPLRARGIIHAALFGSLARGDAGPDSDIMIEIDPELEIDVFQYVGLRQMVEDLTLRAGRHGRPPSDEALCADFGSR
jgi:uncharacterized protein